jgi:putative transposase
MRRVKAYKFKLKPSPAVKLETTLDRCRELYNAALEERKGAYEIAHQSVGYVHQANQLPEIKDLRPELAQVYSQVLQNVLKRIDAAFNGFFRRVAGGERPGLRFKSRDRYDSFTYPGSGFRVAGNRLYLSKIGRVKFFLSRPIEGQIKTCSVKREADGWYVIFTVEPNQCRYLPRTCERAGIDVGLENFATLSTGEEKENPRHLLQAEGKLSAAQRRLSKKKKDSYRRRQARILLARHHQKLRRKRTDTHHKVALELIRAFDVIAIERLKIKGLVHNHCLAKSISDAAWGAFLLILAAKAAEAGRVVVKVDPRGTSQRCLCGADSPKTLKERWHSCEVCGLSAAPGSLCCARCFAPGPHRAGNARG